MKGASHGSRTPRGPPSIRRSTPEESCEQTACGMRGRGPQGLDLTLERLDPRRDLRVLAEGPPQALVDEAPHPGARLIAAPLCRLARRLQRRALRADHLPHLAD